MWCQSVERSVDGNATDDCGVAPLLDSFLLHLYGILRYGVTTPKRTVMDLGLPTPEF